jgi:drug/metabolite transporter (DMT)-like permease
LFAVVFLGEHLTPILAAAILIATAGVLALSWPQRVGDEIFSWRPAVLGVVSGGLFALAAVAFRGGIGTLDAPFIPAATTTLAMSLAVQTVLLSAWLWLRQPDVLLGVLRAWRPSLPAGFLGAFASEMWFLAFAIQSPSRVRTLGLVEILIAGIVSRRLFTQKLNLRDLAGMALVIIGIALLFDS